MSKKNDKVVLVLKFDSRALLKESETLFNASMAISEARFRQRQHAVGKPVGFSGGGKGVIVLINDRVVVFKGDDNTNKTIPLTTKLERQILSASTPSMESHELFAAPGSRTALTLEFTIDDLVHESDLLYAIGKAIANERAKKTQAAIGTTRIIGDKKGKILNITDRNVYMRTDNGEEHSLPLTRTVEYQVMGVPITMR